MKLDEKENRFGHIRSQKIGSRSRNAFLVAGLFAPMALLWGCSGFVNGQSNTAPPPQTYSISGTISPATGGNGTTVTLSGAKSATTTANSSGGYTLTGLANGTYTITPSHAGYTFSPSSMNLTVSGANITTGLDFTATASASTFSISGTISPTAGGSGATVALSGAKSSTTTANSSGSYTFAGLANGAYTITPSHAGYTFAPTSQNATVNGANVSGVNFTATQQTTPTYSISGTISPAAGGSGATVTLSGAATATTTANGAGIYSFAGLANGNYAVTPSHTGYTFNPTSQSATINGTNVTGINFTATANPTFSISGTISPAAGGSGATVTLGGAASASATANSSGNYTFIGVANGTYTVTPSNAGYTFTPVNRSVTINGANASAVNFTATPQQAHSATLSWTASTSTVSGYNVYRGTVNGGPYTLINLSLVAGISYTDTTVQSGVTYYYVTTAVDTGVESVNSNQVTAIIP